MLKITLGVFVEPIIVFSVVNMWKPSHIQDLCLLENLLILVASLLHLNLYIIDRDAKGNKIAGKMVWLQYTCSKKCILSDWRKAVIIGFTFTDTGYGEDKDVFFSKAVLRIFKGQQRGKKNWNLYLNKSSCIQLLFYSEKSPYCWNLILCCLRFLGNIIDILYPEKNYNFKGPFLPTVCIKL